MSKVIGKKSAPLNKDVKQYRRYSNVDIIDLGVGGDYSDVATHETYTLGQQSGGSGMFDWNGLVQGVLNLGNTFVSSFWNNGAQAVANSNAEMLKKEERTNTILWVVIGLVLALLVFLVVRKTK